MGRQVSLPFALLLLLACCTPPPPATPPPPTPPPIQASPPSGPYHAYSAGYRVTSRSFLVGTSSEHPGYGLYSYLLFGTPPNDNTHARYLAAITSYLEAIQDVGTLRSQGIPLSKLNVAYLPVKTVSHDVRLLPEIVLDDYNYARATALLAKVPGGVHTDGPYIVSTLHPLTGLAMLSEEYLYQDLSSVPPSLILLWVKAFIAQAGQERFWESATMPQVVLTLRTRIEQLALALPDVRKARDEWIALILWKPK